MGWVSTRTKAGSIHGSLWRTIHSSTHCSRPLLQAMESQASLWNICQWSSPRKLQGRLSSIHLQRDMQGTARVCLQEGHGCRAGEGLGSPSEHPSMFLSCCDREEAQHSNWSSPEHTMRVHFHPVLSDPPHQWCQAAAAHRSSWRPKEEQNTSFPHWMQAGSLLQCKFLSLRNCCFNAFFVGNLVWKVEHTPSQSVTLWHS